MDRKPRVIFIQRVVPPAHSAAGALLMDMGAALADEGMDVEIIGTRTSAGVSGDEFVGRVRVRRVLVAGFRKSSILARMIVLIWTWVAMLVTVGIARRPDVLVTMTDPPLTVFAGVFLAGWHRCRHIHWAQDVYPDVVAAAGLISQQNPLYRVLKFLTAWSLRRCDRVVAVGRCMQERICESTGVAAHLVTNWSRIPGCEYEVPAANGGFAVLYSGNLGRAHDFSGMNEAVRILAERGVRAKVEVSGDGPCAREVGVEVRSPVCWEDLPAALRAAGAQLITLKREFCGLVVPSKLYDAASGGRPILFVGPSSSECARAVREAGMGLVVPDRDGVALADAIGRLAGDPVLCRELGEASQAFHRAHGLSAAVREFGAVVQSVLSVP